MTEPLEPCPGEPVAGVDPGKLRDVKGSELGLRFLFGAGVSIVAALAGVAISPAFGGMFLAFPAILPATLTLLEKKHGTEEAVHDLRGAVLGALGMLAFAVVGTVGFARWPGAVALLAATSAWIAVSLLAYLVVCEWLRHETGPAPAGASREAARRSPVQLGHLPADDRRRREDVAADRP